MQTALTEPDLFQDQLRQFDPKFEHELAVENGH
jgi:hypothetical protein